MRSLPLTVVLLFAALVAGCEDTGAEAVEVTNFDPASGTYYPGEEAVSSLQVLNNSNESRSLWIGYSVQDGAGRWHDAPARPVELGAGEESGVQERSWSIPEDDPTVSGLYKVKMSVWDRQPGENASRLDSVVRANAFSVFGFEEDFSSLDRSVWSVSSKKLGLGYLEPENVGVENERLQLKIPSGSFEGGEIESKGLYQYGSYSARIKVADAPSSLTGFFLYREPDLENELDIEIHNDPAGRILFTSYSGGEETNTVRKDLPFDPTADFHEYRFDLYPDRAEFYVDGELLHSFDEGLPEDPMNLYVNAWFPTWLAGNRADGDSYTLVDWIRH